MADETKIHEINVWIDDFTPCLKDNQIINTYTYAYSGEEI